MNTFEESLSGQDPDYVSAASSNQVQQKIYEENARNSTARKIIAIVEKEFSREIDLKQKEILQIQDRLHKSLKTLHFLRYVIVTDFYNRKQCLLPQAAEARKQTRIHPAVKSLLGKSPRLWNYTEPAVPSTSTDPRFLPIDESAALKATVSTIKEEDADAERNGKRSSSTKRTLPLDEDLPLRKIPRYVPPKSSVPENNTRPSRGDRHKVRKRIIVGNISKWIPSDWRDGSDASHKWTMYVRGDKDVADISTYVSKVRFFLHPSYRPNDVVEVTSYPFHLSRRGWGEFPLRVQLHFKNALNKPMDIIHHLKLDRTYTGLQMLGSETVVDLWIYTADCRGRDENEPAKLLTGNTCMTIEPSSDDDDSEPVREELEKPAVLSMLRLTEDPLEILIKEEIMSSEIYQSEISTPAVSALTEKSADVETKVKFEQVAPSALSSVSVDKSHLEAICFSIYHDHDYINEQYFKPRCVVRDGNVTIEHFPDNEVLANVNEGKPDGASTTSHKHNGDIQSSSDRQPPTVVNARVTVESQALQVLSLGQTAFQKNGSPRKSLLSFDVNKLQNNEVSSGISENIASKDILATTNGFCKPSDAVLDRLKSLQKAASVNNSHLKPLEISIPPLFTSSGNKHVLFMKNKKLIPMDMARRKSADGDVVRLNMGPMPQGVSILKKPPAGKVNTVKTTGKDVTTLTVKSTNSLLLNVNYSEPALKIADSHDPQYNYNLSDAVRGIILSSSSSTGNREVAKSAGKDEKTQHRTKITLGKDKYKLQSKLQLYEVALRTIDRANITETEAFLRFAVRRLPIVTQDARDPEYRRLHPYACRSEEDFLALSVGKQRALEWHRAKTIKSYLRKKLSQDDDRLWNVKEILMWARLHGYTPSKCSRGVFGVSKVDAASTGTKSLPDSSFSGALVSTLTEPVAFHKWLQACRQESSHRLTNSCVDGSGEMEIDVVTVDENPCRGTIDRRKNEERSTVVSPTLTPLELDKSLMPLHKYVCDTAQEIGIKIAPEEIVPGVVYCAASRLIIRVIECFVEDLTRSSLTRAWERNSGGCPTIITLDDVRNALTSREEFDIFTNEGLGSQQQLSTTN
ncbi:YEATS domain-containing protein 2 [Harpegnathos saltator]|uniref:YEATS domain-containing protein 2 n=1 Tax=Harpegnathos saltator TaxID=610380 RepID=E2C640_HARSA|nr:YEATS domain-containing protein 2 [Harpegnathos saltator]EFN76583.1 YEATS domain-containing protein 2 [Harpegnathos saltator]